MSVHYQIVSWSDVATGSITFTQIPRGSPCFYVITGHEYCHSLRAQGIDLNLPSKISFVDYDSLTASSIFSGAPEPLDVALRQPGKAESDAQSISSSESESESNKHTEIGSIVLGIHESIDCLFRLSSVLRSNKRLTNRYTICADIDTSFYEPFDVEYTRQKFSIAEEF